MNCSNCGNPLSPGQTHCMFCGTPSPVAPPVQPDNIYGGANFMQQPEGFAPQAPNENGFNASSPYSVQQPFSGNSNPYEQPQTFGQQPFYGNQVPTENIQAQDDEALAASKKAKICSIVSIFADCLLIPTIFSIINIVKSKGSENAEVKKNRKIATLCLIVSKAVFLIFSIALAALVVSGNIAMLKGLEAGVNELLSDEDGISSYFDDYEIQNTPVEGVDAHHIYNEDDYNYNEDEPDVDIDAPTSDTVVFEYNGFELCTTGEGAKFYAKNNGTEAVLFTISKVQATDADGYMQDVDFTQEYKINAGESVDIEISQDLLPAGFDIDINAIELNFFGAVGTNIFKDTVTL